MNKAEIIKILQQLKKFEPSPATLYQVKTTVDARINKANDVSVWRFIENFRNSFSFLINPSIAIKFVVILLLFFITIFSLFPNIPKEMIFNVQLAVAHNQYERAQIVFIRAKTESPFGESSSEISKNNLRELAQATFRVNTEMSDLKLMGESGKYTSQQCQELYRNYLRYLEQAHNLLATQAILDGKQDIKQLDSQIQTYEHQAENKLKQYQ